MSEEIEEKIKERYNFSKVKVEKYGTLRGYEIVIYLDFERGFSLVYNWKENYTVDKNMEDLFYNIEGLIIQNFKRRGER